MYTIENVVNRYLTSIILVVLARSTINKANYSLKGVVWDLLDTIEALGLLTSNKKAAKLLIRRLDVYRSASANTFVIFQMNK